MVTIPYSRRGWKPMYLNVGYCQTGQIMNAAAFLESNPNPTEEEINQAMAGNICRCGTYNRIREAIQLVAGKGGNS